MPGGMVFRGRGRGYGYGRGRNQKAGMPTYPVGNKKNQVSSVVFTPNYCLLNILLHACNIHFINKFYVLYIIINLQIKPYL